jgi:hypothetical protein
MVRGYRSFQGIQLHKAMLSGVRIVTQADINVWIGLNRG